MLNYDTPNRAVRQPVNVSPTSVQDNGMKNTAMPNVSAAMTQAGSSGQSTIPSMPNVSSAVRKIVGQDGSTTYTNMPSQPGGTQLNSANSRGTLSVVGDNGSSLTKSNTPNIGAVLNSGNNAVRKITAADGAVTYTNDPAQKGGVDIGNGNLSVIGDPRTEGMTPAQASQYWQQKSDYYDAKQQRRDLDANIQANLASSGDSIGELAAKKQNRKFLDSQFSTTVSADVASDKANSTQYLANLQEDRRDARQQRNLEAQDSRLTAQLDSRERMQAAKDKAAAGKVTPAQAANNAEISLARKRLAGMTMDDIKGKTQQFLPNGRENPAYDPMLATVWRTANQRMVGDDPSFDAFAQNVQPIGAGQQSGQRNAADRFKADAAMSGHTLGAETPNGFEVRDASGNLIGHYR